MVASAILLLAAAAPAAAFLPSPRLAVHVSLKPRMSMGASSEGGMASRRALLDSAFAAALAFTTLPLLEPTLPSFAAEVDYAAARQDVKDIIKKNPDWGPTIVRLAWHASGTYDKIAKNGGSFGGTIRFKEELAHGANAGLAQAVEWMEPIHTAHPGISYGDLYTLAGVAAIEAMNGPSIPWRAGRQDAIDPATAVTPDGRLPAADKGNPLNTALGLRETFYKMGFNDQDIVVLSGAHALGRCHTTASGYDGPWTPTPTTFNNLYYVLLKNQEWTPRDWSGPFQYQDASGKLMMLPSDLVLLEDAEFKKYVDIYAADQKKFFADFSKAFQTLEELGCKNLRTV